MGVKDDDLTRRQAMRLATTAGAVTGGVLMLGTEEGRAAQDRTKNTGEPLDPEKMPKRPGHRVDLTAEEKKKAQRAQAFQDEEQQLPYSWDVPGMFTLSGTVHFPPGADPYTEGFVSGSISGPYYLTKNRWVRITDQGAWNAVEIALVVYQGGGGYVSARTCHRGPLHVGWWCGDWHFLKGWYGKEEDK